MQTFRRFYKGWAYWDFLLHIPPWARFFLGLCLVAVATYSRYYLLPIRGGAPFLTFYPAFVLSAMFLGTWAGLMVVLVSAVTAHYLFLLPLLPIKPDFYQYMNFSESAFISSGIIVCLIFGQMRRNAKEIKEINRRLEVALETAEKAERLKDKFLSLVSHDLKGPLGVVGGFLTIIRDDAMQNGLPEIVSDIESAKIALNRMLAIINELLQVGRFKTGRIVLELRTVNARELVDGQLRFFQQTAERKNVRLANEIPQNLELRVDPALFVEVIQNLVSNAIKFSNFGGTVRVTTPEPGVLTVVDDGVGVPPSIVAKLFNYEEKTSTVGTAGETGTGFGLPLSQDIIKAHGGYLSVESIQGKGSKFLIRLPVEAESSKI